MCVCNVRGLRAAIGRRFVAVWHVRAVTAAWAVGGAAGGLKMAPARSCPKDRNLLVGKRGAA